MKILWDKKSLERFIDDAILTDDEENVLRTMVRGWSITRQSYEMGMSPATISRIRRRIFDKIAYYQDRILREK